MAEEKFIFESMQDAQSIKVFLESLMQGFESERVVLASNGDRIELTPTGLLEFSVKARRKGDASKMSIKVAWKENRKQLNVTDNAISVSTE